MSGIFKKTSRIFNSWKNFPLLKKIFSATLFDEIRHERSLIFLLSFTDESILRFETGHILEKIHREMNAIKNLALEELHRQKSLNKYVALQLLD